mmetsp:Transcript_38035/g.98438  ORF Transcript_38035/g.98438 Transcript_38035/m.98438 type:complete len:224 (-) Transcript_38035:745-1416(-)
MHEEELAVPEERVHDLLAVLQRLSWEEVHLQAVNHEAADQPFLRTPEVRHRARQHVGLTLVGNGPAFKDEHERLLRKCATEQQLVDMGRPPAQHHGRVLEGLDGTRRPWHQQPAVDGGVKAPQRIRRRDNGSLPKPLQVAEAGSEPPLGALLPPLGVLRSAGTAALGGGEELRQRKHVLANELQPHNCSVHKSLLLASHGSLLQRLPLAVQPLANLCRSRRED